MAKRLGRKPIEIIDSVPYSEIIFLVSSGENYAQVVAEKRKKEVSPTAKQMNELKEKGFLISINEKEKKNFPQNKKYFSVNWKKIIQEFVKYINDNLEYVLSENERLGLNLEKTLRNFEERVKIVKDKEFKEIISKNRYLQTFFKNYYSEIGRLKENWTISVTFDFFAFFEDLNFLYQFNPSHDIYNVEKAIYLLSQEKSSIFPDWLLKDKKPQNEKEEFERFKKVHKHTGEEFQKIEERIKEELDKTLKENKELLELHALGEILKIVRIKPSLQLGLNKAVRETGKEVFKKALRKEEIKKYFEIIQKHNQFTIQPKEILNEDYQELIGENDLKATKPKENSKNKSGNTNKKEVLSLENKEGESSK